MSTTAQPATTTGSTQVSDLTLEQKILNATRDSEKIISSFSPQVAALVDIGVASEPLFSGLARMIAGLFHHHTGVKPK